MYSTDQSVLKAKQRRELAVLMADFFRRGGVITRLNPFQPKPKRKWGGRRANRETSVQN